jgi:GntR family transcriptional repressor for pyruvate dehydrogenase complex
MAVADDNAPITPNNFRPAQSSRLYEDVVSQVQKMIADGKIAPGEQLPSERELSEQIGVSRNVLREAFRVLEHRGFIRVRAGAGRFVRPIDERERSSLGNDTAGTLERASLADALEARLLIEPELVRLAANRRTNGDAKRLLKIAKTGNDWKANRAFHVAVAEIGGNFALRAIVEELLDLSQEIRQRKHYRNEASSDELLMEHSAIAEAIAAGNATVAARLMRSHLKATTLVIDK